MVSMRAIIYLLILLILQSYAKVSSTANFDSQASQAANSESLGARTTIQKVTHVVITNRKTLKHANANLEANEKNGLKIEGKETVRKRKIKKRLTKTVSLTADYSAPGHHPPRHN